MANGMNNSGFGKRDGNEQHQHPHQTARTTVTKAIVNGSSD
jgi:hypothetical protein